MRLRPGQEIFKAVVDSLKYTDHRPYPLSPKPWALHMRWLELLFWHVPVPVAWLRPLIPEGLELDTYDGTVWLGIVPFKMREVRPRYLPSVNGVSHFAELNVRTYVSALSADGEPRPGVWFFSLDAANRIAVRLARASFNLPYYDAVMRCDLAGERVRYESRRAHRGAARATFVGQYQPVSEVYTSTPGTLESFLTERYCLYSANRAGKLFRGEIHHVPWPLQRAEAEVSVNTMTRQLGFELPGETPLLHFAKALDVVAWLPEAL